MRYRPMGQSGGGGAGLPEKTVGWLWGFPLGLFTGLIAAFVVYLNFG